MAKLSAKEIIDSLKEMTLLEIKEVVDLMKEEFGVDPSAVAVAAAPAAEAQAEEKSSFNIELKECGPNKIAVIKVVKEITGLGLGEAKALVDGAPKVIKENVATEEAKAIEAKLKEAGATVELK